MSTNVCEKDQVTCVCVVLLNTWKVPKYSFDVATESYLGTACISMWGGPAATFVQ